MEQLSVWTHRLCKDHRKLKVSGCVCSPQLISRRTLMCLRIRASRSTPSMRDQYLLREHTAAWVQPKLRNKTHSEAETCPVGHADQELGADSPVGTAAEEREVIRHGYADEALGVLNDAENSFDVRGPVFGTEDIWRALTQSNNGNITPSNVYSRSLSLSLLLTFMFRFLSLWFSECIRSVD